jgi:RNA polymerase sigma-70 factor (ECF subfamily)
VVQDVFVELWRSAARFDAGRASDRGFVATITRRRVIDRRRRLDRRPQTVRLAPAMERADEAYERTVGRVEAAGAVAALRHLSDDWRRWIVMSVVEGYTHAEIAEATRTPLGTVKSGIRRGLARMRAAFETPDAGREAGR